MTGSVPGTAGAEDAEWPDAGDESAFLSEAASRGETLTPVGAGAAAPTVGANLPPLEELVGKVPAAVRGILDDLFRVKFTGVRRFSAAARPGTQP